MESYKDVYPEGFYRVRVIGNALATAKTSGSTYLALKVEVLEKTGKGEKSGIVYGGHRYVNLYSSEKTVDTTRAILKAAGLDFDTQSPVQLSPEHPDYISLAGFEFSAQCAHDEYKGVLKDKWQAAKSWDLTTGGSGNSLAWAEGLDTPSRAALAAYEASFGSSKKAGWVPNVPITTTVQRSTRVSF